MPKFPLIFAALLAASTCLAQTPAWPPSSDNVTMPLCPNGAPGAQPAPGPEGDMTTPKDNRPGGRSVIRIGNVSNPTLTVYAPKTNNTGAAVVVFPGGGYRILAIDLEGTEVCDWLNSAGITCILVKYRVPEPGPYPKSSAPLQDAQRAFGMVRPPADEWHIDQNRIGVLGFSAGGHLAAALTTLPSSSTRVISRWQTRTSRPMPTFIPPLRPRRPSLCRLKTIRST